MKDRVGGQEVECFTLTVFSTKILWADELLKHPKPLRYLLRRLQIA